MTRLWPIWTAFTAVGFGVGFWFSSGFESLAFTFALTSFGPGLAAWFSAIGYAVGHGLALGSAQALVVEYLSDRRSGLIWGLVTATGETFGIALQAGPSLIGVGALQPVGLVLPGLTLGLAQWIPLRKQTPSGWGWIVMSFISWPIAAAVAEIMRGTIGLLLAGAVYGGITGITLAFLLSQPAMLKSQPMAGGQNDRSSR